MYRMVTALGLALLVSTTAAHAIAVETTSGTLAASKGTFAGLEMGRVIPVECADGTSSVVVHNVRLVARKGVARTHGEVQRARELELRYEKFNTCDFTGTVQFGSLSNGDFHWWQPWTKRARIRARIPLRDTVTGLPSGVAVVRVRMAASEEPTTTTIRECTVFDDQYAIQRIVERSAAADATGVVKVGGVNTLLVSEVVVGELRRVATTVRTSPLPC